MNRIPEPEPGAHDPAAHGAHGDAAGPASPSVPPPGLPQSQSRPDLPQAPPVHYAPGAQPYAHPGGMPGAMYSPYPAQQAGVRPPMNATAIWAFVTSFFIGALGLILGIVASKQIGNTGQRGIGFAMAGFYIGLVVTILQFVVGALLIMIWIATAIASA